MVTRADIVAAARTWLNTPWKHQGRTRTGVDCGGLVFMVRTADLGLPMDDVPFNYRRTPSGQDFSKYFFAAFDRINPKDMLPGDIPLFRDNVLPCHCGYITELHGSRAIIHASARDKRVVEHLWTPELDAKLTHAFRYRELNDVV